MESKLDCWVVIVVTLKMDVGCGLPFTKKFGMMLKNDKFFWRKEWLQLQPLANMWHNMVQCIWKSHDMFLNEKICGYMCLCHFKMCTYDASKLHRECKIAVRATVTQIPCQCECFVCSQNLFFCPKGGPASLDKRGCHLGNLNKSGKKWKKFEFENPLRFGC